jgi:hypothetical protein
MANPEKKVRSPRVSGKVQMAKATEFLTANPNAAPSDVVAAAGVTLTYAKQAITAIEFAKVRGKVRNAVVEGETVELRRFAADVDAALAEFEKSL